MIKLQDMNNIDLDQQKILELYSNYVLRNNKKPLNVYSFCEDHGFSENDFYFYYANFEQLEADYLRFFMDRSIQLIKEEETYEVEHPKHKLLSFYYTFFEQLTMNRSLIIYLVGSEKNNLQNLKKLWSLKREFQLFIRSLGISEPLLTNTTESSAKIEKLRHKGIEELYWGHFVATLKFWMDDRSSNFEKTDIFIEKSVDTSFEFLDVKPFKKLVDLGKFLFNEKVKNPS